MPQDIYPITITTTDSVYTIHTAEDLPGLPDSIRQMVEAYNNLDKTSSTVSVPQNAPPPYEVSPEFITGAILLFIITLLTARTALRQVDEEKAATEKAEADEMYAAQYLIYKGAELEFTTTEVHTICSRYNPFYNKLSEDQQHEFIRRLGEFMFRKDFYIMSPQGYKEMPVLVAAAAIQISFGLADFIFRTFPA